MCVFKWNRKKHVLLRKIGPGVWFFEMLQELWFHATFTFKLPTSAVVPPSWPGSPWKAQRGSGTDDALARSQVFSVNLPPSPEAWTLNRQEGGEEREVVGGKSEFCLLSCPLKAKTFKSVQTSVPLSGSLRVPVSLCQLLWLMFWRSIKKKKTN